MKNLISLFILWTIGFGAVAQKTEADDKTQEKNKKPDQDSRYQEGASGVKRSISYKFSKLLTDEDPGEGIFRYNNDTLSGITYIFVDVNDMSGEDQTKWYSTWEDTTGATARGRLNLAEYEGKNVNVFDVTGVFVREAGYWKIPVKYVSGSLPADGATYYYIFERIENKDKAAKADKETTVDVATVATVAVVTAAAVVPEPVPEPAVQITQPEPVVEVKEEPVSQPEPVVEVKEEPVAQPEPVAQAEPVVEVKEEPVVQQEAVKEESKVEEVAVVAAAVTVAAVIPEPVPEPVVQITQPEPVVEVKEEPVVQAEPVVEVKEEPVVQQEAVKEDSQVKEAAAAVAVVTVAAGVTEPKPEPRVRETEQSQTTSKSETPQPTQPKQESKPSPSTQQAPVSQPVTTTQTSQQQPAPVKNETPASQPAPKTNQPAQKPAQPEPRPTQPQTSPATGYPSSGTGNVFTKRSDGSRVFHGIIETGYGLKVSDYGLNNYRINFIGSFSLGQHFMIGLGLGYRRYFDKPEKHADWYMVSSTNQVPVFLDLRVLLSKKKLTPYLALGLGSSTEKSKSDTTSYGSFINPSAGIWYRLSKNTALFAGVAYEMIEMEYALHADNIPYRRKNNSVSLNIGIYF